MGIPVTIDLDEEVVTRLDALAARHSVSRERMLTDTLLERLDWAGDPAASGNPAFVGSRTVGRDPYLIYLEGLLHEWNSKEDAEAFDHL